LRELTEAITFLFAGYVMPLALFPGWLETISYFLPFAYMIYYPIVAFQGLLSVQEMLQVIVIQTGWIVGMGVVYVMMWRVGVRRFTAVGN
jgi:ABC-2 type transport system permease protein